MRYWRRIKRFSHPGFLFFWTCVAGHCRPIQNRLLLPSSPWQAKSLNEVVRRCVCHQQYRDTPTHTGSRQVRTQVPPPTSDWEELALHLLHQTYEITEKLCNRDAARSSFKMRYLRVLNEECCSIDRFQNVFIHISIRTFAYNWKLNVFVPYVSFTDLITNLGFYYLGGYHFLL